MDIPDHPWLSHLQTRLHIKSALSLLRKRRTIDYRSINWCSIWNEIPVCNGRRRSSLCHLWHRPSLRTSIQEARKPLIVCNWLYDNQTSESAHSWRQRISSHLHTFLTKNETADCHDWSKYLWLLWIPPKSLMTWLCSTWKTIENEGHWTALWCSRLLRSTHACEVNVLWDIGFSRKISD